MKSTEPQKKITSILLSLALSILSGILIGLSCSVFAGKYSTNSTLTAPLWFLGWVAFIPLFFVLFNKEGTPRTKHPFLYGWLTGTVMVGIGFFWIHGLLERFGAMPSWQAAPLYIGFAAYHGLVFGFFASLLCFLRSQLRIELPWLAALSFVVCEFCFPTIFPWYLSASQAFIRPLIQIADMTGPGGISFLLVLVNAVFFDLALKLLQKQRKFRHFHTAIWAGLLMTAVVGYGMVRITQYNARRETATKIKIGVVQGNNGNQSMERMIDNNQRKQNGGFLPPSQQRAWLTESQVLTRYQEATLSLQKDGADLVIWPESSFPYAIQSRNLPLGTEGIRGESTTPLIFNAITQEKGENWNSSLLMNSDGFITHKADKNFLLIFGEYLPYAKNLTWLRELFPQIANHQRGITPSIFPLNFKGKSYALGPLICYEDIIPEFTRDLFNAKTPPNLLINLTNDSWFGHSSEPYEHLALSIYRAVEHHVDLVRAVNTGVSVFIDGTGKIYSRALAIDSKDRQPPYTLLADAALLEASGYYQHWGDTFSYSCLFIIMGFGLLARRRAGVAVRGRYLLIGAVLLHGLFLLAVTLAPSFSIKEGYQVLAHYKEELLDSQRAFSILMYLSCFIGGILFFLSMVLSWHTAQYHRLERKLHNHTFRLEVLLFIISIVVLPVVIWGKMSGNMGTVVLLSIWASFWGLLGEWIGRRVGNGIASK